MNNYVQLGVLNLPFFCGIKYVVPVLYSMAPKVKKTGPSSKIGKRPGQGSRITSQTKYVIHNIKNFF